MINRERVRKEFIDLVQVSCSTRAERPIADALKARLAELGLEVGEDDAGQKIGGNCGNVIAYWKGNCPQAPVMMLAAHMDSVEPCSGIKPQLRDGVFYSDGTTVLGGDDKAGIVGILEALRIADEQKLPHGDIQVVFTISEEGGLNGSKNIDRTALKADLGYVMDSSGAPGTVIVTAPGQNKIDITVIGKTAHAGLAPEEGLNAIVLAGKALAEVKQGRIDSETTANVGIIAGGRATNIVPDMVKLNCETRSRNMAKLEELTQEFCSTFERVVAANGGKTEIAVRKSYDSYVHDAEAPVVQVASEAIRSVGLDPVLEGTGGGSDANFFNAYGIPTADLGVGMSKVHTTEEFIKEEDLYKTAELVLALVNTVAKKQR